MTTKEVYKRCLVLQEAVDDVLESIKNEKDIVILPPAQADSYAPYVEESDKDIAKAIMNVKIMMQFLTFQQF